MSEQPACPEVIRVLVVDNSLFVQRLLRQILQNEPDIEVLDATAGTINALERIKHLKPDVVTLSTEEASDSIQILEAIDRECPIPVIVLNSHPDPSQQIACQALQRGAYDLFPRPLGQQEDELNLLRQELVRRIRSAGQLSRQSRRLALQRTRSLKQTRELSTQDLGQLATSVAKLVVIGASTGGPQALHTLFAALPANFPLPILVVQHMLPNFTQSLAKSLHTISALQIREARHGDVLIPGRVLLAPADFHMEIDRRGRIALNQKPLHCGVRPAVDMTLISASQYFQGRVLGVILTGMGQDGLEGIRYLRQAGGRCLAEDASTCVVYGMPRAIIENQLADSVAPLHLMADRIQRMLIEWV